MPCSLCSASDHAAPSQRLAQHAAVDFLSEPLAECEVGSHALLPGFSAVVIHRRAFSRVSTAELGGGSTRLPDGRHMAQVDLRSGGCNRFGQIKVTHSRR
jgi:hypothetical protein